MLKASVLEPGPQVYKEDGGNFRNEITMPGTFIQELHQELFQKLSFFKKTTP